MANIIKLDPRITKLDDGSLQIEDIKEDDSTTYTCRAFNSVGSATRTYTLQVQGQSKCANQNTHMYRYYLV